MDFFLQRIVVLLVVVTVVNGIQFFVSPSPFYEEDEDVKVICNITDETINGIVNVQNLKIHEYRNGTWTDIANVDYNEEIDNNLVDMNIDGYVGTPDESFLMLTWYKASPYFFGRYRCEGTALDKNNDLTVLKSVILDVQGLARNSFNLFDLLRDNHKTEVQRIEDAIERTYLLENNENEKFQKASMDQMKLRQSVNGLQDMLQGNVMDMLSNMGRQLARIETAVNMTNNSP